MPTRRDQPSRIFRLLAVNTAIVLFLSLTTPAQAQRPGGPAQCSKPAVAPPDTSSHTGSGGLDTTFNAVGYAVWDHTRAIKYVMTLSDGKIIAVGDGARTPDSPTGTDLLVMKLNADGSLDTTFGDADLGNPGEKLGFTYIAITSGAEFINSGAVDSSGRIYAGGWSTGMWYVVRMLPDGRLDTSFSGDGIASVAYNDGGAQSLAIQPDGKILVGGGPNFTVTRFDEHGILDPSFGSGGKATFVASTKKTGGSRLWSLALQRVASAPLEDRIVIGGWSSDSANGSTYFSFMRLRSNGAVDTSFGSNGKTNTSFYGLGDQVRSIAIDTSNRIVAAGITRINSCTATDFGIARLTENGQLDPSFGTGGKAALDLYNDENSVYALAVQPDGKPIVGGNARVLASDPVNRRYYFTLVRFDTAGNLDASFGPGTAGPGVVTTILGGGLSSFIFSLHQQADGKILAGGVSVEKPALARYVP
jgi:uncharacterized delta-60 repeat protein